MITGLAESTVAPLVRAVAGGDLDGDRLADLFARSAWCGIAEPGDRDAGVLIAALGAIPALELVTGGADASQVSASLSTAGVEHDIPGLPEALRRWAPRLSSAMALRSLTQASRFGCRLLAPGDDDWPPGLDDLELHAPPVLWVRGDSSRLASITKSVAIVGARAATGYGEHVTVEAASGLVDRGFAIVSGAAYGIDGVAHRAALASQGMTVAVVAGGLDRFYPSGHEQLLSRIVDRGVVVAEVPCGTAPTRWRFLLRNRLIAAMSGATVVVEAGWRSGSINTAGHAADLGRPVGAVPGPVTSAASAGCHRLLREYAATCVTTADEMAELVTGITDEAPDRRARRHAARSTSAPEPSPEGRRVLDALSNRSARPAQKVAALSGLALDRVQSELGTLELEGLVRETQAGWRRHQTSVS